MAIIDRVEREARCGSVKILSAEIYNKQKKISLIFEHETVPDAEETERLKYYWKNKLKAGDAVQIEVRFRVPEANDPDEIPLPGGAARFPAGAGGGNSGRSIQHRGI